MKTASWTLLLCAMFFLCRSAAAEDNRYYFGVSMFNPNYQTDVSNHRSTGLIGRLGYDINRRFAVETHFGGSIGSESNVDPAFGQAQITDLYSAFLRANMLRIGFNKIYALGGLSYGTREIRSTDSVLLFKDSDTNKSFGFGVEVSDNDVFEIALEWIRYFDNRYYTVDAWNLGVLTHF